MSDIQNARKKVSHKMFFSTAEKPFAGSPVVLVERRSNPEQKERIMKLTLLALGLAMAAGCAHGSGARTAATERRGSMNVAGGGRVLLAGPAETVHASVDGPRPVALYLVDRVHGDDRDCRELTYAQWVSGSAHVDVGAKQELCAVSTGGPAWVLWHAFVGGRNNLWALQ
jgi:hypothetical protein